MKAMLMLLALAGLFAAAPLYAQAAKPAAKGATAADEEQAEAKSGVRFVICSADGSRLPSPLYYNAGKGVFKSVNIGGRRPSPRIRPENGVINFYDSMPESAPDEKKNAVKLPEPVLSFPVSGGGKQLAIIIPAKEGKPQCIMVPEKSFPKSGLHIVNFSSFPLQMTTAQAADFSDKQEAKIGVFHRDNPVTNDNVWSFKGEDGQIVNFMLAYMPKDGKTFKNFKASKFSVVNSKSQINIVVKDAARDVPKLLSIELTD